MRVAVLCTDQGVRIPGEKGASLHLLAITRAFAALGHEVLLVGVEGHGPPPAGVACIRFPHPGRSEGLAREHAKLALTERIAAEAGPALDAFAPDVLYERLALFGSAGARLAQRVGALHVLEVNALLAREEATWRGLTLVERASACEAEVLRRADAVVAVSQEWADAAAEVRGAGVHVVANGFEETLFDGPADAHVRARLGLPDAPLAVFAGALRPWHGVEHAVRALTFPSAHGVHLAIAGDGDLREELERLSEAVGVAARVHLLGRLPQAEVAALLRAADVALAPYPDLGEFAFSPLKCFEYLAAGVPFVASDLGQLRGLCADSGSGALVPAGDDVALADAIGDVVHGRVGFHRERAMAGRRHAFRHYGWRGRAEEIIAIASAAMRARGMAPGATPGVRTHLAGAGAGGGVA